MSEKDIFEDLEKAIDDAFKPKKKNVWSEHYVKYIHKDSGKTYDYMRNEVYDELMFGHIRHRHMRPTYKTERFQCYNCKSKIEMIVERSEEGSLYAQLPGQMTYDVSREISGFFCPICGERGRVIGKVKKVISEVESWQ